MAYRERRQLSGELAHLVALQMLVMALSLPAAAWAFSNSATSLAGEADALPVRNADRTFLVLEARAVSSLRMEGVGAEVVAPSSVCTSWLNKPLSCALWATVGALFPVCNELAFDEMLPRLTRWAQKAAASGRATGLWSWGLARLETSRRPGLVQQSAVGWRGRTCAWVGLLVRGRLVVPRLVCLTVQEIVSRALRPDQRRWPGVRWA